MKKITIIITIALIAIMVLVACSPASPAEEQPVAPVEEEVVEPVEEETVEPVEEAQDDELVLTLEELADFNGQDGKRAYVAVDGVIYDVTDSDAWKNGKHNGFDAGNDLTKEIKEVSPHGISKLANVVEVGKLAE